MTSDPHSLLQQYPVITEFSVQWGDQDSFGHVNNVVYFRWFESSRINYFERVGVLDSEQLQNIAIILASIQCDYCQQLTYPDHILVGASVTRIGNSSMTVRHAIASKSTGQIAAEAEATVVAYYYQCQESIRVPDQIRENISVIEARELQ